MPTRRLPRLLLVAAPLLLAACRQSSDPDDPPFVTGPIRTILEDGRIEVTDETGKGCGAIASQGSRTRVRERGGSASARVMLTPGLRVSVWITGTVRESCPPQVDATLILVEPPVGR